MTLILSALTPEYVLQVCDRRLTNVDNGRVVDDEATKAVLWNNHMAFGYTGLAELMRSPRVAQVRGPGLGRRSTNIWLAEVLSLASSPDEAASLLANEASRAVSQFRLLPAQRGLAFIGVGWTNHVNDSRVRPTIIEVSNLYDERFSGGLRQLAADEVLVHASHPKHDRLVRDLKREVNEARKDPAAATSVLTDALRKVADRDKTVGRDVLQTCLPREQVTALVETGECYLGSGPPGLDYVSFRYVGAGGHDTARSPTVVLGGLVAAQMSVGEEREGAVRIRFEPPKAEAEDG